MKYFNMEKELSLKQTELKDAFVKHQKELVRNSLESKYSQPWIWLLPPFPTPLSQ